MKERQKENNSADQLPYLAKEREKEGAGALETIKRDVRNKVPERRAANILLFFEFFNSSFELPTADRCAMFCVVGAPLI